MLRTALLIPIAATVLLTGCSLADDGPRVTQTRDVDTFTRIDNDSSADVRLHVGEPLSVRVRAGEKVIDDVHTDVRDGVLRVRFDHSGFGGNDVVVEASVPSLQGIDVSGSGDIEADGRTDRLSLDVDGSGDADVADLVARTARVTVSGSGDASVRADDELDLRLDGSGDIEYRGNPRVTKEDDGSGDIKRAG
jgi:hypothetical protein